MPDNLGEFEYDVALSFAGEDRVVAEQFAHLLKIKNIKVFYDEYEAAQLWGKDLIDHLVNIYSRKARYCVMFMSKHYPLKKWTKVERMAAQERAFRDSSEYILPLRLDDTQIPGITETTGYRDLRQHSVRDVVNLLEQKLLSSKGLSSRVTQSHDLRSGNVPTTDSPFGDIPIPKRKKTFTQFEKDRFARESFEYIKQYFRQGLKNLEAADSDIKTVFEELTALQIISKIYVRGDIKAQCSIWLGDNFGPNSICYNEGVHRISQNSINESVAVEETGDELRLHVGFFGMHQEKMATQQEAAQHLWTRFIQPLSYK